MTNITQLCSLVMRNRHITHWLTTKQRVMAEAIMSSNNDTAVGDSLTRVAQQLADLTYFSHV